MFCYLKTWSLNLAHRSQDVELEESWSKDQNKLSSTGKVHTSGIRVYAVELVCSAMAVVPGGAVKPCASGKLCMTPCASLRFTAQIRLVVTRGVASLP